MKKFILTPISVALLALLFGQTALIFAFSDVEEHDLYFEAISAFEEQEIIEGYSDDTFKPGQEINRAEALKIILLSAGYSFEEEAESPSLFPDVQFPDVQEENWFYPYIKKALELNIIHGYPDGYFRPENTVNLVEALKMILNTNEVVPGSETPDYLFADVSASEWYFSFVQAAQENHLIYGDQNGNIYPGENLTRGELVNLIYRYLHQAHFTGQVFFGKATYYADVFQGQNTASGEVFDQNFFTAAHLSLPFDTKLRVTNLATGKTIEVRVNDRGPYDDRYVLDLSKVAFQILNPLSAGVIEVEFEIIE